MRSNDETCAVEASLRLSCFSTPSAPSQEPGFNRPAPLHRLRRHSTRFLSYLTMLATERLTINTGNCTTKYRHNVIMRTDASLPMCAAMEASAIELSPSARLFPDFAEPPFASALGTMQKGTMQRYETAQVDSTFVWVDSMSQSSSSGGHGPVLRGRFVLSRVRHQR